MSAKAPRDYAFISTFYDALFTGPLSEGNTLLAGLLKNAADSEVLEVGVGSGRTLTHIPQTLRYTGIDVSAAMLTIARRRALERQLTNVRLEKMDAKALTFADEKFDLVIAPSVLSAMDDPAAGFKEMVRVVKTGGRIIVIMNLRKKNSLKHSLLKLLGPFTRNVLGYRVDLSLDDLKIPSNVQIREERLINKNLGLYFSTWLVLEKR